VRTPDRDLLVRLGVAAFLAANVMLLAASMYVGWWESMSDAHATFLRWTMLVLATPAAIWCAEPFFAGAWRGMRQGVLHMDVPISLAVVILYGHGVVSTVLHADGYLDSMTMLVALLLVGRVLEARSRKRVSEAVSSMAARLPARARRVTEEGIEEVVPDVLQIDDRVVVGAGEEVPADGVVETGTALVRMALLTGESEPQRVTIGNRVVAGAVVEDGTVQARVTAVGRETVLQQMATRLGEALDRAEVPTAADRIAPWFTGATLGVAALTFLGWWSLAGPNIALEHTVAVLVVACPCALSLAHPLSVAAGLGASARRGLLLRSADALLALATVDLLALDKTGTLTRGRPSVIRADDAVLRTAAGLERNSGHPLARAIVAEAVARGIPLPAATEVVERPGVGIGGVVDGQRWQLRAGTPGAVALEGEEGVVGEIVLSDIPRADAAASLATLGDAGVAVVVVTGDRPEVAQRIAEEVGVEQVLAGVDPLKKADWVKARQREGHRVLFAGDGVNDGPAIATADVGVAMGGGAASSVLIADGVVSSEALGPLAAGIRAGQAALGAVRSGLARSVAYNVLAVTAAVLGWINPLVAAVLMPLSSLVVIWTASRVEQRVR
jgi:heavy metal translocating P-type ATPase